MCGVAYPAHQCQLRAYLRCVTPVCRHLWHLFSGTYRRRRAALCRRSVRAPTQRCLHICLAPISPHPLCPVCPSALPACSKKPVPDELELVETEDQITHEVTLEDTLDPQVGALCAPIIGI